MFDGTFGNHTSTEFKTKILEGALPYRTKSIPIPKVHEEILKTEVNRLVDIGVFKQKIILNV